jgi:hypothetical protein
MTTAATPAPPPWQDTVAQEGSRLLDAMREVAPQITEAVVRYVWAQGVAGLVVAGSLGVVTLIAWWICCKVATKIHPGDDEMGIVVISGFIGLACPIAIIFLVQDNLPKVLAPEGAAAMMALQALGGGQ